MKKNFSEKQFQKIVDWPDEKGKPQVASYFLLYWNRM